MVSRKVEVGTLRSDQTKALASRCFHHHPAANVGNARIVYACEYLGSMELAKKYGSGRLYRLRRWHELD